MRKDGIRIRICLAHMLCYLFLYAILFGWFLFLKSHFLLTTLILMLVLPACSMRSAWWMRRYLSVRVSSIQPVLQEGEEGIWRICLQNDSYGLALSCTLMGNVKNTFLGTAGEWKAVMPISMKYTEHMDLPLGVQYCGLLKVELHTVEYQDPMGLLRIQMPIHAFAESVILPKPQQQAGDHREGYLAGISEAEETLSKGHDFSEVTDMREYRPGDRIKDIHWKLSAKKQDLMVKERASVAQSQVILLLDLSEEYEMVSRILGLAYGLTKDFLDHYVPVRILWWDEQKYDFEDVLIAEAEALEDRFGKILHSHICRTRKNLPELLQRVRPALRSYVYLHRIQGVADGEVISHV